MIFSQLCTGWYVLTGDRVLQGLEILTMKTNHTATFLRISGLALAVWSISVCAQSPLGNGADGVLEVAEGETVTVDAAHTAIVGANAAGATTLKVSDASVFGIGDEVLIITLQDPETDMQQNRVGLYETRRITAISLRDIGNTLTLDAALTNDYDATGDIKHQVVRVPNFTDVTMNGTLTCSGWDGTTGGVLAFRANGTVTVGATGEITTTAKGYRGHNRQSDQQNGFQGESIFGVGVQSTAANGNGGGGGKHTFSGGGGGGHALAGADGQLGNGGGIGYGGLAVGDETMTRLFMGGAGGTGGDNDSNNATNPNGGFGGGILWMSCWQLTNEGTITASGGPGNASVGQDGGAGGGAGGSLLIVCGAASNDSAVANDGGAGFDPPNSDGGDGGNGSAGRTRFDAWSLGGGGTVSPAPYDQGRGAILHAELPNLPATGTSVTVEAYIGVVDGTPIDSATVSYQVNGGSLQQVPMTDQGNALYTADIPAGGQSAFQAQDTIQYFISATDTGRANYLDPPSGYYTFRIAGRPPADATATAETDGTVTLTWTEPQDLTNFTGEYSIHRSEDPNFVPGAGNLLPNAANLMVLTFNDNDPALADYHVYYYKIGAHYAIDGTPDTGHAAAMARVNDTSITTVKGYVFLEGLQNHAGITVDLAHTGPTGGDYTVTTDALGYFEVAVAEGNYDISYSMSGYQTYPRYTDEAVQFDTDLGDRTLDRLGVGVSGDVSGTWDQEVYSITGNVTVPSGQTLVIMPGTSLRVLGNYQFDVNGTLQAGADPNGGRADDDPVVFTSLPPDQNKQPGQWQGIDFNDSSDDASWIDNAIVEYADIGVYWNEANATVVGCEVRHCSSHGLHISGDSSNPSVADVEIHDCGGHGLRIDQGQPTLTNVNSHGNSSYGIYYYDHAGGSATNCQFNNNVSHGARFYNWSSPTFDGCEVNDNGNWGMRIDYSEPLIRNTAISRNSGTGVRYNESNNTWANPKFDNCVIAENSGDGVFMRYRANTGAYIRDCTIRDNGSDGIYLNREGNLTISGNEITGNVTHGVRVDTDYNSAPSSPIITGNVIAFNSSDGIYKRDTAHPTITYNTLYGNSGDGLELNDSGTEAVTNNIIVGNEGYGVRANTTVETFQYNNVDENAEGDISNTANLPEHGWELVTDTTGDGTGYPCDILRNMSEDPLLVDPPNGDFSLTRTSDQSSPCIDLGDPAMIDPDGTASDIGALYHDHGNPHSLSADGYSDGTVSLSWLAVNNSVNGTLTEYRVYYRLVADPPNDWTLFAQAIPSTQTSVDVTGLANNQLYEFAVTGFYDPGARATFESIHSPTVTERPGEAQIAFAPVALSANIDAEGQVENVTVTNNGTRDLEVQFPFAEDDAFGSTHFDGSGDYVRIGQPPELTGMSELTVEAWLKRINNGHFEFVSKHYTEYALYINSSEKVGMYKGYNTTHQAFTTSHFMPANEWHHIAGTWSGNTLTMYVDGVQVGQWTNVNSNPIPDRGRNLEIGRRGDYNAYYTNGHVAEVRIWEKARTQRQIAADMYLSLEGDEEGLLGYWPLHADFNDHSTGGNHGTAYGDTELVATPSSPNLYATPSAADYLIAPGGGSAAIPLAFPFPDALLDDTYAYTIPVLTNVTGQESIDYEISPTYGTTVGSTPVHFVPVDPTSVSYTIIVTEAMLDGATLAVGDEIGVFDGTLCVGSAIFDGSFNVVITCYGADGSRTPGFTEGNAITIKLYDASADMEGTVDNPEFSIGDATFGYNEFSVLSAEGTVFKTVDVPLSGAKFDLVSFNMLPRQPAVTTVFGALSTLRLVQDDRGRAYFPEYSLDTIGDVDFRDGYYVYADAGETLQFEGTTVDPTQYNITLEPDKWNAIAFLGEQSQAVDSAFASISADIDVVEDSDGNMWDPGRGRGDLTTLVPGRGYRVAILGSSNVTFSYPAARGGGRAGASRAEEPEPTTAFVPVSSTGLAYNILISEVSVNGQPLAAGSEIGAFDGELCVGAAVYNGDGYLQIRTWEGAPAVGLEGFVDGNTISFRIATEVEGTPAVIEPQAYFVRGDGTFGSEFYGIAGLTTGELPAVAAVVVVDPSETVAGVTNQRLVQLYIQTTVEQELEWLVTESNQRPAADDPGWQADKPTSYEITGEEGPVTIYVWAKNADGVISLLSSDSHKTITLDLGLTFRVRLTNADVEELTFGQWQYATDQFDTNLDAPAPEPDASRAGPARIFLQNLFASDPQFSELISDFRPAVDLSRWRLAVDMTNAAESAFLDFELPEFPGLQHLVLQKLDGETPVGPPINLLAQQAVEVTETTVFEIAFGTPLTIDSLPLSEGWNLMSIPIMSLSSIAELFSDGVRGQVKDGLVQTWSKDGYDLLADSESLNPELAYWVKGVGGSLQPFSGIRADGVIQLRPGWNLVGPPMECYCPDDECIVGRIWYWDAAEGKYRGVTAGDVLEPGCGYWFFAVEAVVIQLEAVR